MITPIELSEDDLFGEDGGIYSVPVPESRKALDRQIFKAGYEAAEPKWISVEDELPDWNVKVVVLRKSGMPLIGYRQKHDYFGREVNDWNHKTVTHWMPLPSPSKTT